MFGMFRNKGLKGDRPTAGATHKFVRSCSVYCHPETDQVIVASVFNHGGPTAEKPGGATITTFSDSSTLSDVIRASLAHCEYEAYFNYSQRKRSEWPAYQISGYKTIKRFEADFIRLGVHGVNDANLFYAVTTPEFGEFGLHLTVTVNAHVGNYGEAVQYIVQSYLACKAAVGSNA